MTLKTQTCTKLCTSLPARPFAQVQETPRLLSSRAQSCRLEMDYSPTDPVTPHKEPGHKHTKTKIHYDEGDWNYRIVHTIRAFFVPTKVCYYSSGAI